jgi:NhaP-type Na+/H+ or K+/H+ antiporter
MVFQRERHRSHTDSELAEMRAQAEMAVRSVRDDMLLSPLCSRELGETSRLVDETSELLDETSEPNAVSLVEEKKDGEDVTVTMDDDGGEISIIHLPDAMSRMPIRPSMFRRAGLLPETIVMVYHSQLTNMVAAFLIFGSFFMVFGLNGCKVGGTCDLSNQLGLPGPHGYVFALVAVYVGATVCAKLSVRLGMPPLVGMMVGGFVLRNANAGTEALLPFVTGLLRNGALVIILIRAGMGLDLQALMKYKLFMGVISVVPCLVEALTVMGVAAALFGDIDLKWGLLLGFLLADVSPAVTVPLLLDFQLQGLGTKKGIPSLLLAGGANNSVVAIVGYGIVFSFVFASDRPIWMIGLLGLVEIFGGAGVGALLGKGIARVWNGTDSESTRFGMVLAAGVLLIFGSKKIDMGGGGALAVLTMGMTLTHHLGKEGVKPVNQLFNLLWANGGQTMLFGLLGASIMLSSLDPATIGYGCVIVFVGLAFRGVAMAVCMHFFTDGWTFGEKLFAAITWCPKATVQAALSTVALDYVAETLYDGDACAAGDAQCLADEERAMKLLTLAVLSIILTAPTFAALMAWAGQNFLELECDDKAAARKSSVELTQPAVRQRRHRGGAPLSSTWTTFE